jgi:hypothetical protein
MRLANAVTASTVATKARMLRATVTMQCFHPGTEVRSRLCVRIGA